MLGWREIGSVEKFNKEDTDSLDNWSRRRGEWWPCQRLGGQQVHDSGCAGLSFVTPVSTSHRARRPCAPGWRYNPCRMITYIPCGTAWSPYGYRYWAR